MMVSQNDRTDISNNNNRMYLEETTRAREGIAEVQTSRRGSFSSEEAFFLRRLLLDDHSPKEPDQWLNEKERGKILDDEVLLSVLPRMLNDDKQLVAFTPKLPSSHQKAKRRSIKGLWEAHANGVNLKSLQQRVPSAPLTDSEVGELREGKPETARKAMTGDGLACREFGIPDDDASSNKEVRPEKNADNVSVASSWDEEDDDKIFDTWEVLRDEYAIDFGFDYSTEHVTIDSIIADDGGNTFKILGTSASDINSHPHVLSPPLMDAITNFLPPEIQGQNFWMRFSLIRDGASLETLKEYVRAASDTILAIETPDGHVFGSFTSTAWRSNLSFFGGPPAFVWKMRHSRRSKCASLYDQAQLESEIDVFQCTNSGQLVQACRHDSLAVGGDDTPASEEEHGDVSSEILEEDGFAIAVEDDLMVGTTCPSRTFNSPSLYGLGDKTGVFDIAGLEIWSFTPCMDVESAQKLEMTKYFIEESQRGLSSHSGDSSLNSFGSRDLVQEKFYCRIGEDLESEERRQRWQYANMMNPTISDRTHAFGPSPRFAS